MQLTRNCFHGFHAVATDNVHVDIPSSKFLENVFSYLSQDGPESEDGKDTLGVRDEVDTKP